jgi:hypothetical protein
MATVPELHDAYRDLLLRTCAVGFREEGEDVDPLKIWNKFYQAACNAAEGKMTREDVKANIQTFDMLNDAQNIVEQEIERLAEEKEIAK